MTALPVTTSAACSEQEKLQTLWIEGLTASIVGELAMANFNSERGVFMLPAVPPQVYRTEKVYRDLLRVFEALDKFLRDGSRDRYAAMKAGLLDIASAVNELVYGDGNLSRSQREQRDVLIEQAKLALAPQRKRRKNLPPLAPPNNEPEPKKKTKSVRIVRTEDGPSSE